MVYEIIWHSFLAGLATVLGAFSVIVLGHPGQRILALFLGFAGGVMSAVVVFDLLPSALEYGSVMITSLGFFLGLVFMLLLDVIISLLPGIQQYKIIGAESRLLKMGYLIAAGIALHDLPEGIAIAVGYTARESLGILLALSIGLHNVPEGMATATPLLMGGMPARTILATCLVISLFTPFGALLGLIIVSFSPLFISLLLALAGGAMAFIVYNELLPESRRRHPNYSLLGFVSGVCLILALGAVH